MKIPDIFWTISKYPEVYFLDKQSDPIVRVWDVTKADENTPNPQAISQWFLINEKDPERCIEIMVAWFNANRNKGRVVNYAYDRYAWAYREAKQEQEWLLVLEKERTLATTPEAIYEIHKHLAQAYLKNSKTELAIKNWQLAQEAMKSRSNSYIATRYAIPYFEIAKIHKYQGDMDKAATSLEIYLATTHGKQNPFDPIAILGDIYESKWDFGKARKLYMSVLGEDYGKNWASKSHLKSCQAPVRERLRLLTLQEKLALLIPKLASDDGKNRMKAYREIQALGREVVPYLERYMNHENLEIRGSMQELIRKL